MPSDPLLPLFLFLSLVMRLPVEVIRMTVCMVLASPLSAVLRLPLSTSSKSLYCFVIGFLMSVYCFGYLALALVPPIIVTYVAAQRRPDHLGVSLLLFNSMYLSAFYLYQNAVDPLVLNQARITLPMCIMSLKLIGVGFDTELHQRRSESNMSLEREEAAGATPSLLHVLGFCFFPPTLFPGPAFFFDEYTKFVSAPPPKHAAPSTSVWRPILRSLLEYFISILMILLLSRAFSLDHLRSPVFAVKPMSIPARILYVVGVGWLQTFKYLAAWATSSLACHCAGISRDPADPNSFSRITNARFFRCLMSSSLAEFTRTYNIRTGKWLQRYIVTPLREQGVPFNQRLFLTCAFLAVWHGFQWGYYITFLLNEPLFVEAERKLRDLSRPTVSRFTAWWPAAYVYQFFCIFLRTFVLYYSMIPFFVLQLRPSLRAMSSLYYGPHIAAVAVLVVHALLPESWKAQRKAGDRKLV